MNFNSVPQDVDEDDDEDDDDAEADSKPQKKASLLPRSTLFHDFEKWKLFCKLNFELQERDRSYFHSSRYHSQTLERGTYLFQPANPLDSICKLNSVSSPGVSKAARGTDSNSSGREAKRLFHSDSLPVFSLILCVLHKLTRCSSGSS